VKILDTAAHGGFATERGRWAARRPDVVPIVPEAVTGRQLVTYSEMEYTAFCRRFEAASTEAILRNEPNSCVVLVNDISEGVFTIFHLDGRRSPGGTACGIRWLAWGTPPAMPTSTRRPAEKTLTLLPLSRISPEKNQHVLLEALLDWERRG
jgi:glycosyltransferase involved in cell wall biosynthesis